jgi:hypothetical protein
MDYGVRFWEGVTARVKNVVARNAPPLKAAYGALINLIVYQPENPSARRIFSVEAQPF